MITMRASIEYASARVTNPARRPCNSLDVGSEIRHEQPGAETFVVGRLVMAATRSSGRAAGGSSAKTTTQHLGDDALDERVAVGTAVADLAEHFGRHASGGLHDHTRHLHLTEHLVHDRAEVEVREHLLHDRAEVELAHHVLDERGQIHLAHHLIDDRPHVDLAQHPLDQSRPCRWSRAVGRRACRCRCARARPAPRAAPPPHRIAPATARDRSSSARPASIRRVDLPLQRRGQRSAAADWPRPISPRAPRPWPPCPDRRAHAVARRRPGRRQPGAR